jgi:hypothetical protein
MARVIGTRAWCSLQMRNPAIARLMIIRGRTTLTLPIHPPEHPLTSELRPTANGNKPLF